MAYVTNNSRLCQAIVDGDLQQCEECLAESGADPNCREHTGRTPLHLAITASSPDIVEVLVNRGARLVSRLADGRTALHLAASRGGHERLEMVRIIMKKSEQNEEEDAAKVDARKKARLAARQKDLESSDMTQNYDETICSEDGDIEMIDSPGTDGDIQPTITGSYVKVEEAVTPDDLCRQRTRARTSTMLTSLRGIRLLLHCTLPS